MADIVRNQDGNKTVVTKTKAVDLQEPVEIKNQIEVTLDNYDRVAIKMLEGVNINLMAIIKLLVEIRDKK